MQCSNTRYYSTMEKSLQIQVISEETIKPASPTPENLRNYQFSLFDQNSPPTYMPMIYFYPSHGDDDPTNIRKVTKLKESLSETLKVYYPLAGRHAGDQSVECNDDGALFVEAKANCSVDDLVINPVPGAFNVLVPFDVDEPRDITLAVQVTHFKCGGISVGVFLSHKIADGVSLSAFVNSWATVARGENDLHRPIFEAAKIFPPMEIPKSQPQETKTRPPAPKEEVVGRILKFPSSKISLLQDALFDSCGEGRRPSRVEALSGFLWSRLYASTVTEPDPTKIYTILHVLNLRPRFDPPLSGDLFGDITGFAISVPATENGRVIDGPNEIVRKIQESFRNVDGLAHVNHIRDKIKITDIVNEIGSTKKSDIVPFIFTSLCRFPWHEADFGWGKPIRIGLTRAMKRNMASFIDSPTGDGVESCMNLSKEDMDNFLNDPEVQNLLAN